MNFLKIVLIATLLLALAACERDTDTTPTVNPTIQFSNDSGYTFQNDTIAVLDTARVGIRIARGTDAMHHFKVTVSYDGGSEQTTDSLPMGTDNFEFDKTVIARAEPGLEKWTFNVIENDGDAIKRSITFTVE